MAYFISSFIGPSSTTSENPLTILSKGSTHYLSFNPLTTCITHLYLKVYFLFVHIFIECDNSPCSYSPGKTSWNQSLCPSSLLQFPQYPERAESCKGCSISNCLVIEWIAKQKRKRKNPNWTPWKDRFYLLCIFCFLKYNCFIEIEFIDHTIHPFKVCNSMAFSILTNLEYFHHPKKKSHTL